MKEDIESLKNEISNYIDEKFHEKQIFRTAFIHTSTKGFSRIETNDILELIGDKVLDIALYHQMYLNVHPLPNKGQINKEREKLLSEGTLARLYDALHDLDKYIIKPPAHKLDINDKVKHNIIESIFGAILMEYGYGEVQTIWKKIEIILRNIKI